MPTSPVYYYAIIAMVAIAVIAAIVFSVRNGKKRAIAGLKAAWSEAPEREYSRDELAAIEKGAAYFYEKSEFGVDATTWADLEMDRVFTRANNTQTYMGDFALYALLQNPEVSLEKISPRLSLAKAVADDEPLRLNLQMPLRAAGRPKDIYLSLLFEKPLATKGQLALCIALLCALITCIILPIIGFSQFIYPAIAIGAINLLYSFWLHNKAHLYVNTVSYVMALAGAAARICRLNRPDEPLLKKLNAMEKSIAGLSDNGFLSFYYEANPFALIFNHLFLIEAITYSLFASRVETNKPALREMVGTLGEIDAAISIASFRASLPLWCEPQFLENGQRELSIQNAVHPLMPGGVPNSLALRRNVLLTGSNATGKSTFIKTVMLCAVLAQSLGTCTAESYTGCFFHIASSIALRDNLLGGESYFIVELKAAKRLLDWSKSKGLPGLFAIDEVLRGTNTLERIAASTELLRALARGNCLCLAATHDLELTQLLEGEYTNMHFSESIGESGMVFDYTIKQGPSRSRNAITLMEIMGFDPSLVSAARLLQGKGLRLLEEDGPA